MECNVFSNPEKAIINGGLFFERLLDIILDTEAIPKGKNPYASIEKLKSYNVMGYEIKNKFHRARELRNVGVHQNPNEKQAFQLCAVLFHISIWFYEKYAQDSVFKRPAFDRSLIVEKDKKFNGSSNHEHVNSLEDLISGESKTSIIENSTQNYSSDEINHDEEEADDESPDEDFVDDRHFKTKGSYLLTELSKLKKSSRESIEDSEGLNDKFKEYMHVDRDIQFQFKNKLDELGKKDSSQLIMLAGSVGDGKSHLLSYLKSNAPNSINPFEIHNDATESFDPDLTAIETLMKILKPFSDDNIDKSNKKLILAINLGVLNDLMDNEIFISDFSRLHNILIELNIFDTSTVTNNITNDFLTIINFSDYQLYELNEDGVSSNFISSLLNKVVQPSYNNPFYSAYKKDLELKIKSPILYNYEMLMNEDVQDVIIQSVIKIMIKNKKLISTRELLNFIYEILVPADIIYYSNMMNIHNFIDDLMPNLLFNTNNRSSLLKDIYKESPMNIRSEVIDDFIISLNTLKIKTVLNDYFEDYDEFRFFKEYLLSENYSNLSKSRHDKPKQTKIKNSLIYYLLFFGNERVKNVFEDELYNDFLDNLYYYNYNPLKLRKLFTKLNKAILTWSGSIKQDYIIIDKLPSFSIAKRINLDFQPIPKSESSLKNSFKNSISYNVHIDGNICEGICNEQFCNKSNCIKLNIDYSLFESIIKINKGYRPNKNEKENLIVFDEFIQEILSKTNNNELLIYYINSKKSFRFRKSSGYYYSLVGE